MNFYFTFKNCTKYFSFFTIFFLAIVSCNAQYLYPIYFGSNIFTSPLQNKNDLKLALNVSHFGINQLPLSYQTAYSPIKNFGIKAGFRNCNLQGNSYYYGNYKFRMEEFNLSAGYYKKIYHKRGLSKYNWQIEKLKNEPVKESKIFGWKNNYRTTKGKELKTHKKFRRQPFYFYDIYLGYGFADLNLKEKLSINIVGPGYNSFDNIDTINFKINRYNLDASFSYFTMRRFSFSYNLRMTLVNFKNFETANLDVFDETRITEINKKSPFFALESALKFGFTLSKFDLFLQYNDVYGFRYGNAFNIDYAKTVHNRSLSFGVVFNLEKFLSK